MKELSTTSVVIKDQKFFLHASGALYWKAEDSLVISDVHLGKVTHFRKFGSAVPQKAVAGNFERLSRVVNFYHPKKILFLGDLFHSSQNKEWQLFENWMEEISSQVILIEGNHDIISPVKYESLGISLFPEFRTEHFLFTHHPEKRMGYFNFSGHLHPGIKLSGGAKQTLRLPCFFKTSDQMILPAFGEFTGKHMLTPKKGDQVYVLADDKVIPVK